MTTPTTPERHTPTPWRVSGNLSHYVCQERYGTIALCESGNTAEYLTACANAARIVASVNACATVPTASLTPGLLAEALGALRSVLREKVLHGNVIDAMRDVRKVLKAADPDIAALGCHAFVEEKQGIIAELTGALEMMLAVYAPIYFPEEVTDAFSAAVTAARAVLRKAGGE